MTGRRWANATANATTTTKLSTENIISSYSGAEVTPRTPAPLKGILKRSFIIVFDNEPLIRPEYYIIP